MEMFRRKVNAPANLIGGTSGCIATALYSCVDEKVEILPDIDDIGRGILINFCNR
jgi:hypothetical protein